MKEILLNPFMQYLTKKKVLILEYINSKRKFVKF